jgi:formate hydrogenlyase transcriptional activator
VDDSWLSMESVQTHRGSSTLTINLLEQEKKIIESALAESTGRVAGPCGAAASLGMPSSTLESKIKAFKINKHRFKLE